VYVRALFSGFDIIALSSFAEMSSVLGNAFAFIPLNISSTFILRCAASDIAA
jgi:hypothetical protein